MYGGRKARENGESLERERTMAVGGGFDASLSFHVLIFFFSQLLH